MSNMLDILKALLGLVTTPRVVQDIKILAAAENYAAEDVMSDNAAAGTFWKFNLGSQSGVIQKAIALCSTTGLTPRLTLFLFSEQPTCVLNDNAANTAVLTGDANSYEGKIDFSAMEDLGTGMSESVVTGSTTGNLPLPYYCEGKTLYGVVVTRDAITDEAALMSLRIKLQVVEQL